MAKSIKLNITPDFNFILLGLVTSEPIYRVAWLINELLNIQLKETEELIQFYNKKKTITQNFIKYSYLTENEHYYHLFQNKGGQGVLIEEYKNIDYWIAIEDLSVDFNKVMEGIKQLNNISLVFKIDPSTLKSKNKLFF